MDIAPFLDMGRNHSDAFYIDPVDSHQMAPFDGHKPSGKTFDLSKGSFGVKIGIQISFVYPFLRHLNHDPIYSTAPLYPVCCREPYHDDHVNDNGPLSHLQIHNSTPHDEYQPVIVKKICDEA